MAAEIDLPESKSLLPTVAAAMARIFGELEGRALAVSEANITKENMPTLPLCMVALMRGDVAGQWNWRAANGRNELADDFFVDFWLKPLKYLRADGSESPFWAFYDYEEFRDRLLNWMVGFRGPRGQRLEYKSMAVESDQYAVVLSFRLASHYDWCRTDEESDGESTSEGSTVRLVTKLCTPKTNYCPDNAEELKECDPCPPT